MKRIAWVVAMAAVIIGALLLVRFMAGEGGREGHSPPTAAAGAVATPDTTGAGEPASSANATPSRVDDDAKAAPPPGANTASGTAGKAPAAGLRASGGPRPLREDDLPRLRKAETMMGSDGGTTHDLLDLAAREEQDDDARRIEQMLALAIRRHGDHYTGLRLSPPHCTRSVCIVRGIGAGNSQDPRSNWQRLSSIISNEPWFRDVFDDGRSMVTFEGGEAIYISLYVRCEPGKCRHGRR